MLNSKTMFKEPQFNSCVLNSYKITLANLITNTCIYIKTKKNVHYKCRFESVLINI